MKKTVCLILILCMLCGALVACGTSGTGTTTETTHDHAADETTSGGGYTEPKIDEFDEDGKFILDSTEDRKVYPTEDGYVVFSFSGESLVRLHHVIDMESKEEAVDFIVTYMHDHGKDGGNARISDDLVILNVYSQDDEYFKYYAKTKSQIVAEFENEGH